MTIIPAVSIATLGNKYSFGGNIYVNIYFIICIFITYSHSRLHLFPTAIPGRRQL